MFTEISGANIVMGGAFTNQLVTASLKNVEWKAALNMALGSVSLAAIEDDSGILMVVPAEQYDQKKTALEAIKPLVTRSVVPRYLSAVDLAEQIKAFKVLSPRGSVATSQSVRQDAVSLKSSETRAGLTIQNPSVSTALVITDIPEYADRVEALVRTLDRREPQVYIEARIINVASGDSKKLGFDWEMLDNFGVEAGLANLAWNYSDTHAVDNRKNNAFNQYDRRANQDAVNRLYDINGQPFQQETKTDRESPPGSGNYVTDATITPTRTIADSRSSGRDVSSDKLDTVVDSLIETRTATAFLNVSQVSLFLSALEKNSNAEMISHPQIVVGNRVEAKIHVGEKYPVLPTVTEMVPSGNNYIPKYSDGEETILDLGLTLWVIPEIDTEHNTIRMTVRPETATQSGEVRNEQTGKTYPIVISRDLLTRVNVPSGHTVAIGGLVETSVSKVEKKVPILGDIPLLGLLFRHTADAVTKNNLIILLTPTILDDRKPLTGLEAVARLTVDKLEKIPLAAVPAPAGSPAVVPTNAPPAADGMTDTNAPAESAAD